MSAARRLPWLTSEHLDSRVPRNPRNSKVRIDAYFRFSWVSQHSPKPARARPSPPPLAATRACRHPRPPPLPPTPTAAALRYWADRFDSQARPHPNPTPSQAAVLLCSWARVVCAPASNRTAGSSLFDLWPQAVEAAATAIALPELASASAPWAPAPSASKKASKQPAKKAVAAPQQPRLTEPARRSDGACKTGKRQRLGACTVPPGGSGGGALSVTDHTAIVSSVLRQV